MDKDEDLYVWTVEDLKREMKYGGYDTSIQRHVVDYIKEHMKENQRLDMAIRSAIFEAIRSYEME